MKRWMAAAVLLAAACGGAGGGSRRSSSPDADPADKGHALYLDGKLDAAETELKSVVARDPSNSFARRLLGRLYLLKGNPKEAVQQFYSYVDLVERTDVPIDSMALQDLFWALYRMDDYATAAKAARKNNDSIFAVKYGEIARRGPPYVFDWRGGGSSVLSFEGSGTVSLRINGSPGRFTIDFGAGEIVLAREFAKQAGVQVVGIPSPNVERDEQAVIETVDAPGLQVRNVPAVVSSQIRRGVDGVLGVSFLSHVRATLDYRRNRLVLRPAGSEERDGQSMPLLFAPDRTLLAPAKVDGIDTYVIVNPTARGVRFAPSQALFVERARANNQKPLERAEVGPLSVRIDEQTPDKFPSGVDVAYGFIIGGMVGSDAFGNRSVTFDFKAMKILVE
jgi:hypothetical protein